MGQIFCDILDLQISLKLSIHCLKQFFCDVFLYFEYIKIILTKEIWYYLWLKFYYFNPDIELTVVKFRTTAIFSSLTIMHEHLIHVYTMNRFVYMQSKIYQCGYE